MTRRKPINISMIPPVPSNPQLTALRLEIVVLLDAIDESQHQPTVESLTPLRDDLRELCKKHGIKVRK